MLDYINLHRRGELQERIAEAWKFLEDCVVCPRQCHVNRIENERGFCNSGFFPMISSWGPHYGEEAPLVGTKGSGTIFLTNCNMRCEFCQNYEISQCGKGDEMSFEKLAEIMVQLQKIGCHNINFVSPTHFIPQIIKSLEIAIPKGLNVPLVYNSGGYDAVPTIQLLDGIFDIYMPDAKYGRDDIALALSHAPNYSTVMRAAIKEMYKQVGDLVVENGIAVRGLIIRHLVLPYNLANSEVIMKFIREEVSRDSYVNIMAQYRWPRRVLLDKNGKPNDVEKNPLLKLIQRPINIEEFAYAIQCAKDNGLHRGFENSPFNKFSSSF